MSSIVKVHFDSRSTKHRPTKGERPTYERIGVFTQSDLTPTISFDLAYEPDHGDFWEYTVGIVMAPLEHYWELEAFREVDVSSISTG